MTSTEKMLSEKIAICAVIKDEHQYLDEWITYHKNLGIEYIHLYEDEGSKSHNDICSKYDNVFLTQLSHFISDIKTSKQLYLYNGFIRKYINKYDYVFFIDLDEFVTFEDGYNMEHLINICNKNGAVLLYWKYYGANGIIDNPNCNVVDAYTKPLHKINDILNFNSVGYPYKSFVRLKGQHKDNYMKHHHIHYLAKPISFGKYNVCWLNHYITKSWVEWCDRILKRGQIVKDFRKLDDFFLYNPDMVSRKNELMSLITKENYGTNL